MDTSIILWAEVISRNANLAKKHMNDQLSRGCVSAQFCKYNIAKKRIQRV